MTQPARPRKDRGATLLSVLLIIALMSVAALAATDALARSVSVSRTSADRAESFWVARGATAAGEQVVNQVMEPLEGKLTAGMDLFNAPVMFAYERGAISITLRDATNCFNLNRIDAGDEDADTERGKPVQQLSDMLEQAGLFASDARQLSDALADWMDEDNSPRPYGAEESLYRSRHVPHRTAGTQLVSMNDLRAIEGFTPDVLARIDALICVRTSSEDAPLNINTLTAEQAPLLAARFSDELSARDAERIILSRPEGGWLNADEFLALPEVAQIAPAMRSDGVISIISSYLEADISVASASGTVRLLALYGRDASGKFVLQGSQRRSS